MGAQLNLLFLEDHAEDVELALYELRQAGYQPEGRRVETRADYLASLHSGLDIILADYNLPQFNALNALHLLQKSGLDIPFIVVTGSIEEVAIECMRQGAADYLLKDRLGRLGPAIERALQQKRLRLEKQTAEESLKQAHFNLVEAYEETIRGWSRAMDLRDHETEGHTERVSSMTLLLARGFQIPDDQLIHLEHGALLHDMGKMAIPDAILHKPGPLNEEEWVIMRKHPQYAVDMLSPISYLRPSLDIPLCHHERWDGTGYPHQMKGEQIPLAARIFAIVDVWDALSYDRVYRPAWPREQVLQYIREQSGMHFEPRVASEFLKLFGD